MSAAWLEEEGGQGEKYDSEFSLFQAYSTMKVLLQTVLIVVVALFSIAKSSNGRYEVCREVGCLPLDCTSKKCNLFSPWPHPFCLRPHPFQGGGQSGPLYQ
ncbi:hypothetical protein KIL84_000682 [Mauremys mutica]|uniref:Uncharacterized protein n=1 Tax=Mauremys mutica TaxID=74926 RepID=A0A9D3WZ12_9SAUR|nr:hypothetical protein KIL84_000682 [Mauremys mutica]